jgi:SAM-dependent methyltransferase
VAAQGARVLATDLSPVMVEALRRRGIAGAEHRVMDMQAIDLPDASVDAVVSRFGYMLVPDAALAFRETRRVLKPGRPLAFATWAPANRNPWATAYGPVLIERGLQEPPKPGEPGQFALGEPERIEELVNGAGFAELETREVPVEYRFPSWDEYSRVMNSLAASLRVTLAELDEDVRAEVDAAARARLDRFLTPDGYALPGVALVTRAR